MAAGRHGGEGRRIGDAARHRRGRAAQDQPVGLGQHVQELAIGDRAVAGLDRLRAASRADCRHAQHLQQRRDVAADRPQAHDHRALALEVARRALAQPGLPGVAALGIGQQGEASVERDQRPQGAVRDGDRRCPRGGRHLDAASAQFAIERPLGAGGMDLQPLEAGRLAQHGLEAFELGRRIVLARAAGHLARHEGDIGLAGAVGRQRLLGRAEEEAARGNGGLDTGAPRLEGVGREQQGERAGHALETRGCPA